MGNRNGIIGFNVPPRYQNLELIASGAEGIVCRARDTLENRQVAIKRLHNPFETIARAKHAYREINIIQIVNHRNIVRLFDIFTPQIDRQEFSDIYIVMDFMESNLFDAIHTSCIDSHRRISFLMYQLLCAINHLHNAGIIHRDIKPQNVLVRPDCTLKLADFGHSRGTPAQEMTGYVTTRYYRAPEVIVGATYNEKIDVWSLGCTMAEIISRQILFEQADELELLNAIVNTLGTPSSMRSYVQTLPHGPRAYIEGLHHRRGISFQTLLPNNMFPEDDNVAETLTATNARDLIRHMLVFNPTNRITIRQCINHPYIRIWIPAQNDPYNAELNAPTLARYNDQVENEQHAIREWRNIIFDQITRRR